MRLEAGYAPRVGSIVRHRTRPDWGAGRVVACDSGQFWAFFPHEDSGAAAIEVRKARRFLLTQAERFELLLGQEDPLLANLPAFVKQGPDYELPAPGMSLASAQARFLALFPGGFSGDAYLGDRKRGERRYKLAAHERFIAELGGGRLESLLAAGQVPEAVRRLKSVLGSVNLLHAIESAALADALAQEAAAHAYLGALSRLLAAPEINGPVFDDYLRGFFALPQKRGRVHSWVVCTSLPFLAQPERFMHLKPKETNVAASRLGFDLRYDATPNWVTYERLLVFARWLAGSLEGLGCRDMIDVQSFVFATWGYQR